MDYYILLLFNCNTQILLALRKYSIYAILNDMNNIHERNFPSISKEEQEQLKNSSVAIIGCGGLGGYIIEFLVRIGVGHLTVVDGDVFEYSNFNRQILATENKIGQNKAIVAKERALLIDPLVKINAISEFFSTDNSEYILTGCDLVMDALDNPATRLLLEDVCTLNNLYIVHGAIEGWNLQVSVIPPGAGILHTLYQSETTKFSKSSLSFTPPLCASLQVAEAIKILCKRKSSLENQLLIGDIRNMDFDIINMV